VVDHPIASPAEAPQPQKALWYQVAVSSPILLGGLVHVNNVLIVIQLGPHCAAGLRAAHALTQNGVNVVALVVSPDHRQTLPPELKIIYPDGLESLESEPEDIWAIVIKELETRLDTKDSYQLLIVGEGSLRSGSGRGRGESKSGGDFMGKLTSLINVCAVHSGMDMPSTPGAEEPIPSLALSSMLKTVAVHVHEVSQ